MLAPKETSEETIREYVANTAEKLDLGDIMDAMIGETGSAK